MDNNEPAISAAEFYRQNKPKVDAWNEEFRKDHANYKPGVKILAVDDDLSTVEAIGKILKENYYYVQLALQAEDALKLMEKDQYDLIFSGLNMPPGMNGMEFLKIVKQKYPATEFVLVTAWATEKNHKEALALGALEYLRKPFLMEEIYYLVERALIIRRRKGLIKDTEEEQLAGRNTFHVMGLIYDDREDNLRQVKIGDELAMVREPNNPHDPNAIMVKTVSGKMLGYVPRYVSEDLASRIDRGEKLKIVAVLKGERGGHGGVRLVVELSERA